MQHMPPSSAHAPPGCACSPAAEQSPARGSLSAQQLAQFRETGWLLVEGAVAQSEFAPLERALTSLIDAQAATWLAEGKVAATHAGLPFGRRLAALAAELSDELYDSELRELVAELDGAHRTTAEGVGFFFCEGLLDAVESVVGGEISANPISHIRPYVPARSGR